MFEASLSKKNNKRLMNLAKLSDQDGKREL